MRELAVLRPVTIGNLISISEAGSEASDVIQCRFRMPWIRATSRSEFHLSSWNAK